MVGIIKSGHSVRTGFRYNELKVEQGVAMLLMAENYPRPIDELTSEMRLKLLLKMASLNQRCKVKSIHISLNFDPSDYLTPERLRQIAAGYAAGIGIGNQPYLVYQHFDAGHPHLHLLTTAVDINGQRIPVDREMIRRSGIIRKKLDQAFCLARPEDWRLRHDRIYQQPTGMAQYGKTGTVEAINKVLHEVLDKYLYTSMKELNALLSLYRIQAHRGLEGSTIYKNRGLVYYICDETGSRVGKPVKASVLDAKPTLAYLEGRFASNFRERQSNQCRVKIEIDFCFRKARTVVTPDSMTYQLRKAGIHPLIYQEDKGSAAELIYVDHINKAVWHQESLPEEYHVDKVFRRLGVRDDAKARLTPRRYKALSTLQNVWDDKVLAQKITQLGQSGEAALIHRIRHSERRRERLTQQL